MIVAGSLEALRLWEAEAASTACDGQHPCLAACMNESGRLTCTELPCGDSSALVIACLGLLTAKMYREQRSKES